MRDTLLKILLEQMQPFQALEWLDQPHWGLDGKTPSQVIKERGYEEVLAIASTKDAVQQKNS